MLCCQSECCTKAKAILDVMHAYNIFAVACYLFALRVLERLAYADVPNLVLVLILQSHNVRHMYVGVVRTSL